MSFLTCLYGFRGSKAQMSAIIAFLLIADAVLDLICSKYYSINFNNIIIKKWYLFNISCILAGIAEIIHIRGKITKYATIYGLRFYQYILMLIALIKSIIFLFITNEIHSTDVVYPIFMLMLIFILNAKEQRLYTKKLYTQKQKP